MVQEEYHLKIFLIWYFGGLFDSWRGTLCVILVKGIMRNISMNLFQIWVSGSVEISFKGFIIWSSGGPRVQKSRTIYAI